MIKKLNTEEIETINASIEKLKDNEYYKYYFCDDEIINFPEEAYLIDDTYYIDFTKYDNFICVGVINLRNKVVSTSYFNLMYLLRNRLEHYKKLYLWCYLDNSTSIRFHNLLIKKLNARQVINDNVSIIELGGLE